MPAHPPLRNTLRRVPTAVVLLALAACGDQSGPAVTQPTRVQLTGLPACQRADAHYLATEIHSMFASSARQEARTLERAVENGCPSKEPVLDYITAILAWRQQGLVTGTDAEQWAYLSRMLGYIGYTLDQSVGALGPQGFIAVCGADAVGCSPLVSPARTSGIKLYPGSLDGRYLVTGAPAPCSTIASSTNLQTWGQCIEVSVDPKPGPSFTFGGSGADLQMCYVNAAPAFLYSYTGSDPMQKPGKVVQLSGGSQRVNLKPPAPQFFEADCDAATLAQREVGGGGLFAHVLRGAWELVAPRPLFAGHGGLGSITATTGELSRFGPADPFGFQATFTNDIVGQPPGSPDRNRGYWTIETLNPGDILVQSSLGDITSNLVVIDQAGGAAGAKAGLRLLANLAAQPGQPSSAAAGSYRIRWRSVVASPKAFEANFVALDSQGRTLARFTYQNGEAARSGPITFNGTTTGVNWTQYVSQQFQILVDLDARRVSFALVHPDGTVATLVSDVPYADPLASDPTQTFDLARAGWVLTRIDAQIVGMDDLEIVRVPDPR